MTQPSTLPVQAGDEDAPIPHPPTVRVARQAAGADLAAAEVAAADFLRALGISTASESLKGTPGRMARAYAELFTPAPSI